MSSGACAALPASPAVASRSAARVAVTAGKPTEFGFTRSAKTLRRGRVTFVPAQKGTIAHVVREVAPAVGAAPWPAEAGPSARTPLPGRCYPS
jgi:hypothetical protein